MRKAWPMNMRLRKKAVRRVPAGLLVVMGFLLVGISTSVAPPAEASLYWFQGVQTSPITLCFVGDALTSRPDRVEEILTHLKEFEGAANIQFDYWGTCPPSITQPTGYDYFNGDIRVVIPNVSISGTGPVPGVGCPMFDQMEPGGYNGDNDGWGSWSNSPNDLGINRSCQYNLKLGDDPWNDTPYLNHTLHEFGHALGLAHEHERLDATCYDPSNDARWTDRGYLTTYDMYSVMHYKFETSAGHTCDTPGNYGRSGLTERDRLALHILYPEDVRVAEFVGTTVIRAGETLHLQSAWFARGAYMPFVASDLRWKINGVTYSQGPQLWLALDQAKDYTLEFSHQDFLGRDYVYTGIVRVLSSEEFARQIAAPVAANLPLLYPNHVLPLAGGTLELAPWLSLSLGSGTFDQPVVLDFAAQSPANVGSAKHVGRFYSLEARYLANGEPASMPPNRPYTVTVNYDPGNVPDGLDEENLALYSFSNLGQWQKEKTSQVDVFAKAVTASPNHFSSWALLSRWDVHLPVVLRGAGPP
jgi:hypothetical protein